MRALIIDEKTQQAITALIDHAKKNPFSLEWVTASAKGERPPAGDYEGFKIEIPQGIRVVYSIEEQSCGPCSHLSVSVEEPGKLPSIAAVNMIAEAFGMGSDIHDHISVWLEEDARAINVLDHLVRP